MGKRGREYRVRVTVPMSSSQTEALFPRRLSSRSQVSGRGSFIRFPALLASHGPGRRLRENICRLEGYLGQKRESLPFQSQPKITQKRKGQSVKASQWCLPLMLLGSERQAPGPWRLKSPGVTQLEGVFGVRLLTCSPAGLGRAEQAPGCAVAELTS